MGDLFSGGLGLGQIVVSGIAAIVCFFMAMYFLKKAFEAQGIVDGPWGDASGEVNVINLNRFKKRINALDHNVIINLYTNNMLAKLLVEEGALAKAKVSSGEGKEHAADLLKIAEYFKIDSESFEKITKALKQKEIDKLTKFNNDSVVYLEWFVDEYLEVEEVSKKVEKERELLSKQNYKKDRVLRRRMLVLELYQEMLSSIAEQMAKRDLKYGLVAPKQNVAMDETESSSIATEKTTINS